jgi:hypothetical protein
MDVLHSLMRSTTDMASLESEMAKLHEEIDTWVEFVKITQPESMASLIEEAE